MGNRFNVWFINISVFKITLFPPFTVLSSLALSACIDVGTPVSWKYLNNAWWASFLECIGNTCTSPNSVTNVWAVLLPLMDLIPNIVSVYTLPRNLRWLKSDWCVLNFRDNGCNMLRTALWVVVDTTVFALSIPMPYIWASFWALVFGSLINEVTFAKRWSNLRHSVDLFPIHSCYLYLGDYCVQTIILFAIFIIIYAHVWFNRFISLFFITIFLQQVFLVKQE